MTEYLKFKKVWIFTPFVQVSILILFFVAIAILGKMCVVKTGLLFGKPTFFYLAVLFAPVYEEIIFRGSIFGFLVKHFSLPRAIIYSSLLFGIWHLKNIFFVDPVSLAKQICYTGLVFAPIMCLITYKTNTIWIASILHYLNNFTTFILFYSAIA
jgi:membrane protease YdiL (CAAX protease family)